MKQLVNNRDRIYHKPRKPAYMTTIARKLRKNQTPAEEMLWRALRQRGFFGCHLRRQAPFGRYVFDIYCAKKRIAFEIDGSSHLGKEEYDARREGEVGAFLVRVVRFRNEEVLQDLERVLETIRSELGV